MLGVGAKKETGISLSLRSWQQMVSYTIYGDGKQWEQQFWSRNIIFCFGHVKSEIQISLKKSFGNFETGVILQCVCLFMCVYVCMYRGYCVLFAVSEVISNSAGE